MSVRRPGFRGLGGAFDMNATIVPADTQVNVTSPASGPVDAAKTAYGVVAPLTKAAPSPLTVLKPGTTTVFDWARAGFPVGSDAYGPDGDAVPATDGTGLPQGTFAPFGGRVGGGAVGVDTASTDVGETHTDVITPDAPASPGAGDPVTLDSGAGTTSPARRVTPARGFPWWILWILGGVVVVGGTIFVLRRR